MPTTGANSLTAAIRVAAPGPSCKADVPNRAATFLNVDDDFRFTQFFGEVLILVTQLLVLFVERGTLGLGTALLRCQGMQNSVARSCRHVTR